MSAAAEAELGLRLWELADWTLAFAMRAVAALGIADQLAAGSRPVAELAAATRTHAGSLRRALRVLAAHGVLEEPEPDRFGLSATGELLRSDHPLSLRDAYLPSSLEVMAWGALDYSLRTGRAAFEHVHGQGHLAYSVAHPEEDARMQRAYRAGARIEALTAARAYDWSKVRTVVDVGGSTGAFIAGLLSRFKRLHGVLLDLPGTVAGAAEILAGVGVADRCQVVAGDFFDNVPPGADVYLLKSVLGAWDDDDAQRILCTIRAAMRGDSRLVILEPILGYGDGFTVGNTIHLQSLVLYGGPDRTREDYDRILTAAKLRVARVVQRPTLPLLEVVPD